MQQFPTDYTEIVNRINSIDPVSYAQTRNYLTGSVTYLSPYISRGVISTKQVLEIVLEKTDHPADATKLIQELAWREYYQRIWQHIEEDMFEDIRNRYTGITHKQIPTALLEANTGINSIDTAIQTLYETGYMHNHLRMYLASITCNIAKSHWSLPSQWMYYHLLDGDLASNTCSWQWVAGSFSGRQYYCNQENINKYTGSNQQQTFLDTTYEELPDMKVPDALQHISSPLLKSFLPEKEMINTNKNLPLQIYTTYNLDPLWRSEMEANRILLLEPSHFAQYPVSENVMQFILQLAKNINGLQVFVGELNEIPHLQEYPAIYSKEHPLYKHIPGIKDERDWMFPEVKGFYNSFFSFWKKCEPYIRNKEIITRRLIRA
jgi:deoxyribodipyrimidine photo-lyase